MTVVVDIGLVVVVVDSDSVVVVVVVVRGLHETKHNMAASIDGKTIFKLIRFCKVE